jgi:hypothetical protein
MNDLTIPHDLSGFEMQARWYNEYAIGYSHAINDKLVVGAKVKFLAGMANAALTFDDLAFNTSAEAWGIKVVGSADISAPFDVQLDANGFPENFEENIDMGSPSELIDYAIKSSNNPGFGIDAGVDYQVIPRLKLSASIIDIGKINWKRNVTNLNLEGEYEFKGLNDLITTDGDGIVGVDEGVMDELEDTLKHVVSAIKTHDVFSNTLFPKVFFGAEYEFTKVLSLGVLYKARFIREEVRQNVYFNANANFKRFLTLGVNYNYGFNSQNSYGSVIGIRLTPFYLYLAADVLPGYSKTNSTFGDSSGESFDLPFSLPADLSAANFQFGVNITIGGYAIII